MEFTESNYIVVPGFAVTELGLTGSELLCWSLIWGFSQDGGSCFEGSQEYLRAALGLSDSHSVRRVMSRLEGKGLLRREGQGGGAKTCRYAALRRPTGAGVKMTPPRGQSDPTPGVKMTPNKIIYNNTLSLPPITPLSEGASPAGTSKASPPAKGFAAPTLDEVRGYVREKGYAVDADRLWNYYEANGWMVGRNRMKNWRAAVAMWESREFGNDERGKARRPAGAIQVDDFDGRKDESTI